MIIPGANEVENLSKELARTLKNSKRTMALAESCTGGAISHIITNTPGSSEYFLGAIIAYSNESKIALLGVKRRTLNEHGAVSAETVREMATGVRSAFDCDIGLAVSGIAGPSGGTAEKPVGTVFIGIDDGTVNEQKQYLFRGDRLAIKREVVLTAMGLIIERHGVAERTVPAD